MPIRFPSSVLDEAWKRSRGRCECRRKGCGHSGRCSRLLWKASQGKESRMGWEAHHVNRNGPGSLTNCEVLCQPCHKNTRSFGRSA